MSSTRNSSQWEIYQHPVSSISDLDFAASLQSSAQQYAPIMHQSTPTSSNQYITFDMPEGHDLPALSPLKQASPQSSPLVHAGSETFDSVRMPPPSLPAAHNGSPIKRYNTTPAASTMMTTTTYYQAIAQKPPQKATFTTFPAARVAEHENMHFHHQSMCSDGLVPYSDPVYGSYKPVLGKRFMSDAITAPTPPPRAPKKLKADEDIPVQIPEPEDMPALKDEGVKPNYSYAQLIGMAILRAPNRRLTLAQIYKWISDTFVFYRTAEPGWMNSIRHNLSLNKSFEKKERPKDDRGKGNYWVIVAGQEAQFLKAKLTRRSVNVDFLQSTASFQSDEPHSSTGEATMGSFALPPKPKRIFDSSRFPGDDALSSSDGTLPASDPITQEDAEEAAMPPPSSRLMRSSPSPANINSSPPVPRHAPPSAVVTTTADGLAALAGTAPLAAPSRPVSNSRPSSRPGSRQQQKRSHDTFRDSGFYSSIDSSVARGHKRRQSSCDEGYERPIKRGRAEEEIARIRASSYDSSPTKMKLMGGKRASKKPSISNSTKLQSSSPLRSLPENADLSAYTPGMKIPDHFFLVNSPPVSPNTHLLRHRESIRDMVGTPAHTLTAPEASQPNWTPAFSIHADTRSEDEEHQTPSNTKSGNLFSNTFANDFFEDPLTSLFDGGYDAYFARGSPVKSGMKRPNLQRAATSAGILGDVTESRRNIRLASPINLSPTKASPNNRAPAKKGIVDAPKTPVGKGAHKLSDEFWGWDFVNQSGGGAADEGDHDEWLNLSGSNETTAANSAKPSEKSIDLTQGFRKIGSTNPSAFSNVDDEKENRVYAPMTTSTSKTSTIQKPPAAAAKAQRPALARSMTNVF